MTQPIVFPDLVGPFQRAMSDELSRLLKGIQSVTNRVQVSAQAVKADAKISLEGSLVQLDLEKLLKPIQDKATELGTKAGESLRGLGSNAKVAGRDLAEAVGTRAQAGLRATASAADATRARVGDLAGQAATAGRQLGSGLSRALGAVRSGASSAAGAMSRFLAASRSAAAAAMRMVSSLAQLAVGYARAALQAGVAAARTVAMAVAQRVVAVATRTWAAVQRILNIVMSANPIGLVIAAIGALVVAIVLAYRSSSTFRAIVQAAMRGVAVAFGWASAAARAVFGWVQANWPLLLGIITGPIGLAVLIVARNWDRIRGGAAAVWRWITNGFNGLVGFVQGLPGQIGLAAQGMWDGIAGAFRGAVNAIIAGWNSLQFRIPGFSLGPVSFGGFTLGLPDIPSLARGALVPHRPGGTLAVLGEGREDELVVPLSRLPALAARAGAPVTVNVYPRAGQSEYEIGRIAARELAWAAKS